MDQTSGSDIGDFQLSAGLSDLRWQTACDHCPPSVLASLFRSLFENLEEGIMVIDADKRIIMVNTAFSTITGYQEKEVMGKTPAFLRSGMYSSEFFRSIWDAVDSQGRWRGELVGRRKNGVEYPESITIKTMNDPLRGELRYLIIFRDITEIEQQKNLLRFTAYHDDLTGLANRRLFWDRLKIALAHARRYDEELALAVLDIDNFKLINDVLGHETGDFLLRCLAGRLKSFARGEDTLARIGADDFALLMPGGRKPDSLAHLAMSVLSEIQRPFLLKGEAIHISASMGITLYPQDGSCGEELLSNADLAMSSAKSKGGKRYQFFKQEMNKEVVRRMELEHDMRAAIKNGEFFLCYQPKVDLAEGAVHGAEALVRWAHPRRGLLLPGEFISLAEDSGLIVELGNWILEEALRFARDWSAKGGRGFRVAVNLSPRQLMDEDISEKVATLMERYRLSSESLELEVTETALMQDLEKAVSQLDKLAGIGISIAMDDFGCGHSSLKLLQRLPIHVLKIDRSFIAEMLTDKRTMAITRTILDLGRNLGLKVVAEGVENTRQLRFLCDNGCSEAQGFLLSKPVSRKRLELMLNGDIEDWPGKLILSRND